MLELLLRGGGLIDLSDSTDLSSESAEFREGNDRVRARGFLEVGLLVPRSMEAPSKSCGIDGGVSFFQELLLLWLIIVSPQSNNIDSRESL